VDAGIQGADLGACGTKWSDRGGRRYDPRALPRRRTRLLQLAAVAAALAASLLVVPGASADLLTPESGGSQNANDIDTLYKITLYVAIVIFLIVEGTLIWSLVKFRRRRGGPEAAQVRGNTPLELGWTVAAALILVVLTVVTFLYLDDIKNPPASGPNGLRASQARFASIDQPEPPKSGGPALTVHVNGQQYIWRYDYPGKEQLFSYHQMVVPTDTTVVLEIESSDVIHSWWIPKFGPKADAVPGHVNETWFKVPAGREGVYTGNCAELCGPNHADMRARVRAVTPDEFEQWAHSKRAQIKAAGEAVAEQRKEREKAGAVE
jgi:cytochrome c oxidase subunit II